MHGEERRLLVSAVAMIAGSEPESNRPSPTTRRRRILSTANAEF
jgi:hypothetical protein